MNFKNYFLNYFFLKPAGKLCISFKFLKYFKSYLDLIIYIFEFFLFIESGKINLNLFNLKFKNVIPWNKSGYAMAIKNPNPPPLFLW